MKAGVVESFEMEGVSVFPLGAEDAYLFSHSLWRDHAYEGLTPFEHARLHAMALDIYERHFNVEADKASFATLAAELAQHAQAARLVTPSNLEYEQFLAKEEAWNEIGDALRVPRPNQFAVPDHTRTPGEALRASGRHRESEAWYNDALGRCDSAKPWATANLLLGLASVYMDTGRPSEAQRLLTQAIGHYRTWGCHRGLIMALTSLGTTHKQLGNFDNAIECYREAEELNAEGGDELTHGYTLVHLAVFYHETGRLNVARVAYLEALKALRQVGDRRLEGMTLGALANLFRQLGYSARAEACYRETLALHEAARDKRAAGIVLGNLASLYQDGGRMGHAEDAYLRALEADRETGNLRSEAIVRGNLAILYRETGRIAAANRMFMVAIDQLEQVGDSAIRAAFVAHRGMLCLLCGDLEGAEADNAEVLEHLDAARLPTLRLQHALPLKFRLHVARAVPLDFSVIDDVSRDQELAGAHSTLAEIRRLAAEVGHTSLSLTSKLIENCQSVLNEIALAHGQWRPPVVFRGHRPSEIRPQLRQALLAWMSELDAECHDSFHWQNPELMQAMKQDTGQIAVPDWSGLPEH